MRKRKPEENQGISAFARGARRRGPRRAGTRPSPTTALRMREMMADVAEFKAARLRKNREYEGLVKEKEIRGMDKVKWAPNAQNRATTCWRASTRPRLTCQNARHRRFDGAVRARGQPPAAEPRRVDAGLGLEPAADGRLEPPNSRGDNAHPRAPRVRAANFAATLRAGVDSQGAFR
ncbi:hypothetical protein JL722_7254 [Aureococcus anophagefferens]|nr:hypothetical protein JL722_7254 [Aureococcus anophagefferens]